MNQSKKAAVRYAFRQSLPVLSGYLFLGSAYGILLHHAGFGPLWALFTSCFVYAGSLQFVLVNFMAAGTALPTVALMSLFINSRHLFYGLSFIEKFKAMGKRGLYMVFGLSDETFSVLCSLEPPADVNRQDAMFFLALFNQGYWVCGSVLGAFLGNLPVDFTGIDFSMTALFMVLLLEQWRGAKGHLPVYIGLLCGVVCFVLLGPDGFLLPALLASVSLLLLAKPLIEAKKPDTQKEAD